MVRPVAATGLDDLDLDGNWTASGAEAQEAAVAGRPKKRKRPETAGGPAAGEEEDVSATAVAKKRKGKRKTTKAAASVAAAPASGGPSDSAAEACGRLLEAWAAEAKTASLSALEMKEVAPLPTCSAERSVKVAQVTEEAWHLKPLVLSAYGGGRRKDQVARQAKALEAGVAVGIGTPGRILRLLDEGHLDAKGLELVVVDLARDLKERDVLTLPETRRDFFALLRRRLLARLGAGSPRLRLALCGGRQAGPGGG